LLALTGFTVGFTSTLEYLHGWVLVERLGLAVLALGALLLFAQSLFSLYLMLYTWEEPNRLEASKGPGSFLPPQNSFSVLLPARHEEAVIFDTIKRAWAAKYPSELLEIVVVCHADDEGTIAEARRAIGEIDSARVRVETFSTEPINKPHGEYSKTIASFDTGGFEVTVRRVNKTVPVAKSRATIKEDAPSPSQSCEAPM
jgi:cellulose synthase/poly-beta-1,6-N-acetylglucosamine synthase-like glycosyltransferase